MVVHVSHYIEPQCPPKLSMIGSSNSCILPPKSLQHNLSCVFLHLADSAQSAGVASVRHSKVLCIDATYGDDMIMLDARRDVCTKFAVLFESSIELFKISSWVWLQFSISCDDLHRAKLIVSWTPAGKCSETSKPPRSLSFRPKGICYLTLSTASVKLIKSYRHWGPTKAEQRRATKNTGHALLLLWESKDDDVLLLCKCML